MVRLPIGLELGPMGVGLPLFPALAASCYPKSGFNAQISGKWLLLLVSFRKMAGTGDP